MNITLNGVKFATFTQAESEHVETIIARIVEHLPHVDRLSLRMDLSATHASCPLDLERLAAFDDFNLLHDVGGISGHLDRATGRLTGYFLPRCARGDA